MSYDEGIRIRREVLGAEHVEAAQRRATEFTRDFQELTTRFAWGDIWARPGLDRRTRSCITIAMLVALGRHEELALHVRAALRNGLTQDEIAIGLAEGRAAQQLQEGRTRLLMEQPGA